MATMHTATRLVFIDTDLYTFNWLCFGYFCHKGICIPNKSTLWEDFLSMSCVNEILELTAFVIDMADSIL